MNMHRGITFIIGGNPIKEKDFSQRLSSIAHVKDYRDYRIEQLSKNSYRIMILPETNADTRGIKGAVLDACVDIYGIKGRFDIDIISDDNELLPQPSDNSERMRNYLYSV